MVFVCLFFFEKKHVRNCHIARGWLSANMSAHGDHGMLELEGGVCNGNAGPCYFAYVMFISQPSSHASPGDCGGTENSSVLKRSTTKT